MNMALRVPVALGALVLSAFIVGCGSDEPGMEPGTEPDQSLTDAELVACSDGIGLGTITKVEDTKRAEEVGLSLAMDEWLKPPADVGRSISFVTASAAERGERPFRVDERVLFVLQEAVSNHLVYRELRDPTSAYSAQGMGEEIRQILRRDTDTPCPSFWGKQIDPRGDSLGTTSIKRPLPPLVARADAAERAVVPSVSNDRSMAFRRRLLACAATQDEQEDE